jgi:hypothetical protein
MDVLSFRVGQVASIGYPIGKRIMRKTKFTFEEAVDVWLRYWAGQVQSDIAADYRINAGRVNEVLKERKHLGSKASAAQRRSA